MKRWQTRDDGTNENDIHYVSQGSSEIWRMPSIKEYFLVGGSSKWKSHFWDTHTHIFFTIPEGKEGRYVLKNILISVLPSHLLTSYPTYLVTWQLHMHSFWTYLISNVFLCLNIALCPASWDAHLSVDFCSKMANCLGIFLHFNSDWSVSSLFFKHGCHMIH